MIRLHYLKTSCAQRVAWLLQELGLDYEVAVYDRMPETRLAPPELKRQHPLQKSPVLEDGGLKLAESAAIIQHLIDRCDTENRLSPPRQSDDYSRYLFWMHNAASVFSAAFIAPLSNEADLGAYQEYARAQLGLYLDHIEDTLRSNTWLLGDQLSGADFAVSFPVQWAIRFMPQDRYPQIRRYVAQIENTPSYRSIAGKTGHDMTLSAIS